jgi:hypothetical protein
MFLKDPGAALDYRMDWSALLPAGVTLVASGWTAAPLEPGGLEVGPASSTATAATVRLHGGIEGHSYRVVNRVTLSDGSIDERMMVVRVEER